VREIGAYALFSIAALAIATALSAIFGGTIGAIAFLVALFVIWGMGKGLTLCPHCHGKTSFGARVCRHCTRDIR
jgi:hypothetical protein